jgi:hypothetical protein
LKREIIKFNTVLCWHVTGAKQSVLIVMGLV